MKPRKLCGVLTLRALGRVFWLSLAASLALHAFLLASWRFQLPDLESAPALEARLEAVELKGVTPPSKAGATQPKARPQISPHQNTAAPKPLLEFAAPQTLPAVTEMVPPAQSAQNEPVLPPSTAEPQPPSSQPYSALTQAAQRIRQLPDRIEIVYELEGLLSGRQTHVWQKTGERYSLETEGEVTGLAGLFMRDKMIQKSFGRIGPLGLTPEQYEMRHLSGKQETLRFDYEANTIESTRTDSSHGTRTLELPMITGAQDPLTSIYQLAMVARDDSSGLIVAASAKRVKGYPYRTLGMETLHTPLGKTKALHVTRAGDSEKSSTHLWLAPERFWLPVKISHVDDNGVEWMLEAVSIKGDF